MRSRRRAGTDVSGKREFRGVYGWQDDGPGVAGNVNDLLRLSGYDAHCGARASTLVALNVSPP